MPSQPQRYDRYGRPLPDLAEVQEHGTFDHTTNQAHRSFLHMLVEDCCRVVCRRGWYGQVTLTVSVQDGLLQQDMRVGLERVRRPRKEEPPDGAG